MDKNIRVTLKDGYESSPTVLKVEFGGMPYYFAFRSSQYEAALGIRDKDFKKYEAMDAISSFLELLKKELIDALPEHLKFKD